MRRTATSCSLKSKVVNSQLFPWKGTDSAMRHHMGLFLFSFAIFRNRVEDTEANPIFLKRPWSLFKVLLTRAASGLKALIRRISPEQTPEAQFIKLIMMDWI